MTLRRIRKIRRVNTAWLPTVGSMNSLQLTTPTLVDAGRICALIRRSEAFDHLPRVYSTEELIEELSDPHIDLTRDVRLARRDGDLVGWVRIGINPSGSRLERADVFGHVDPVHRGTGVGRVLMTWATEVATVRLQAMNNNLAKYIRTYTYTQCRDAQQLMSRLGYVQVRWFDDLLMSLDIRPAVAVPSGMSITAWPKDRGDEILAVKNISFRDHWGSTPTSAQQWHAHVDGYGSRLDLSFVAIDQTTAEIVGMCHNTHYPDDEAVVQRREGWIATLGTLRDHRGRGIASALIAHSLEAFAGAGFTHALIGVDSDNPTGASRLYRSLGFQPDQQQVAAQIQVA